MINRALDSDLRFVQFRVLRSGEELRPFGEALAREGFTAIRRFLDAFREYLRAYADDEMEEAMRLVASGRSALPHPEQASPSWEGVWTEYGGIVRFKNIVLRTIPREKRDGEWQVLLDNPYTNHNIVVYPAMSFMEAAYTYAYFRTGLTPNEYIRLQKIETVIADTGDADAKPVGDG